MRYITSVERIGLRKGFEKGIEKGIEKGLQQGRGQVLVELLTHRFGPLPEAVTARIEADAPAEIGRWARRILEARTLDEVFADD